MPMFRKKPVVIEAVQWTGANTEEIDAFLGGAVLPCGDPARQGLRIHTLEGIMLATAGDWIIKGVAGEFYPCKPDIFLQTYEPVSEV